MTTSEPQQSESRPECAALVSDLSRHATWHARVAPARQEGARGDDQDRGPEERIIGNMR